MKTACRTKTALSSVSVLSILILCLSLTSCASNPADGARLFLRIMDSPAGDAIFSSIDSIGNASKEITPENEYYIGRSVAAAITSKYPVYTQAPVTTEYLNAICGVITMNSDMPYLYKNYSVAILDTDEINAMATPGGHIFISRGLIQAVNSEDALAAVIAHEVAHIQLKHSINAIKASRITNAVAQATKATAMAGIVAASDSLEESRGYGISDEKMMALLEATDSFSKITDEIVEKTVNSGFSKSQEYDADEKALSLMADAGYDPSAMVEMLEMIPTGGNHGWYATHPSPANRLSKVNKILSKMSLPSGADARRARQKRTARFEKNRL